MAEISVALRTKLVQDPSVHALVGNRVYDDVLYQVEDAVTVQNVSSFPVSVHNHASDQSMSRFQLTAFGKTRETANAIARAIKKCLDRIPFYVSGVQFIARFANRSSIGRDTDSKLFGIAQDFMVIHDDD